MSFSLTFELLELL